MQITLWHTSCSPGLLQGTVHDLRIRYRGENLVLTLHGEGFTLSKVCKVSEREHLA
jgi:hypothetical protein